MKVTTPTVWNQRKDAPDLEKTWGPGMKAPLWVLLKAHEGLVQALWACDLAQGHTDLPWKNYRARFLYRNFQKATLTPEDIQGLREGTLEYWLSIETGEVTGLEERIARLKAETHPEDRKKTRISRFTRSQVDEADRYTDRILDS